MDGFGGFRFGRNWNFFLVFYRFDVLPHYVSAFFFLDLLSGEEGVGEVDARAFLVLDPSKISIQNLRICVSMSVQPPAMDVYPDERIPCAHACGDGNSRCLRHATNIVRRPHWTMGSRIVVCRIF